MDKQLLKTIIVTMAIVFAYQYFFVQPQLEQERAQQAAAVARDSAPVTPASGAPADSAAAAAAGGLPAAAPGDTAARAGRGPDFAVMAAPPETRALATPELALRWDNRDGGVITGVQLNAFRNETRSDSLQFIIVPAASRALRLAFAPAPAALPRALPQAASDTMLAAEVPGQPVTVTYELIPAGPYLYTLRYRLRNPTAAPVTVAGVPFSPAAAGLRGSFSVSWGPTIGETSADVNGLNPTALMYRKGASTETVKPDVGGGWFSSGSAVPEAKTEEFIGDLRWAALTDRYFIAALVPDSPAAGLLIHKFGHEMTWELIFPEYTLAPGEEKIVGARLYLGPKEHAPLAALNAQLEDTLNFGWFAWLGVMMLTAMNWFNAIIPNFGLAIILLTLLVRVIMYPLTYTSYQSMQRMQALQPKMQEIRARHPNSPEKQQQEIMKMYQQEKVNPLGGCLPVLLQLPIFIALYQMLQYSIELRQAPFIWWITDLSQPDTIGFLPAWLPFFGGAALNILPLFMAATMFFQQKMSMTGLNPQQEKIMMFMPVMLLFMLYKLPSGLMLYWSLSNIVGIVQQKYLTRGKKPALPPAAKPPAKAPAKPPARKR